MSVFTNLFKAPAQAVRVLREIPSLVRIRTSRPVEALRPDAPTPQAVLKERKSFLAEFYSRYEDMVELLCDAAQYGPNPALNSKYDSLRSYMLRCYPQMRLNVIPFLDFVVSDTEVALDLYGHPTDAFESLWAAPTLEDQMQSDDGTLIERIVRTRESLQRYSAHLRQLEAK